MKLCPIKLANDFIEEFDEVVMLYERKMLYKWFNDNVSVKFREVEQENEKLKDAITASEYCLNAVLKGCHTINLVRKTYEHIQEVKGAGDE